MLFKTLPRLGKEWRLSFKLLILSVAEGDHNGYSNVLHATTGSNCCELGQRIPAIFMNSGKVHSTWSDTGTRLVISRGLGIDGNDYFETSTMPLNEWIHIEIEQEKIGQKYFQKVVINGDMIRTVENNEVETYENVKLFTSDNFHPPSDVEFCDVEWTSGTCKMTKMNPD